MKRRSRFLLTVLMAGLAFLYLPILSMIFFSFNRSRLATVWGGFSTEWYGKLFANAQIMDAASLSLRVGLISATLAAVLGTLAGFTLARFRRFPGRTGFAGLVSAPLVMPEVITGLSLLLFFVAAERLIGWPQGRGALTVTLAHATFSLSYVAVIVQARLAAMDRAIEEAALDLGSTPLQVFRDITLPLTAPAIISGWLLAFTLSLDDVVITSFTTGPGATTLPLVIFSKVRLGMTPDINALASLIVLIVSIGVFAAGLVMLGQEKRREADIQKAFTTTG